MYGLAEKSKKKFKTKKERKNKRKSLSNDNLLVLGGFTLVWSRSYTLTYIYSLNMIDHV